MELKTIKVDHETWKTLRRLSVEQEKSIGNLIKEKFKEVKKMKIIIEGTNGEKYFEKTNDKWEFVDLYQPKYPGKEKPKMTEDVSNALDIIADLANPEQEKEFYYDFDRNRDDNQEEEFTVLDWLDW